MTSSTTATLGSLGKNALVSMMNHIVAALSNGIDCFPCRPRGLK